MFVLHAGLVGPLPEGKYSSGQHRFQYRILSVVNLVTWYLWLMLLHHKSTDAIATALFDEVISRVAVLSTILTEGVGEFTGEVMQHLCNRLGISRLLTSAYHTQTDAKCQRTLFSIHNMIMKLVCENHDCWLDLLVTVAIAYNSTIHSTTRYCPHELFYIGGDERRRRGCRTADASSCHISSKSINALWSIGVIVIFYFSR